jgi:copper homeostasis protein
MKIEFCISTLEGALAAEKWKADRVELCSDLNQDGLTPSFSLIKSCTEVFNGETHVMIRPHNNGFIYSKQEIKAMIEQIKMAKKANAFGVVFGILDENNSINIEANQRLINEAKKLNLSCTFHRAYDYCSDPKKSIEDIIGLQFDWLLTSGQKNTAIEGINLLKEIIEICKKRIQILAGSGVDSTNAKSLSIIGVDALHFTIDKTGKVNENKIASIKRVIQ